MNRPPPSFLTSVATTSIPTPRPAAWVTRPAVLKPGSKMSCMASSSVSFDWRSVSPSATAFSRISLTLMPPPSSVTTITISAPSRVRLTEMRPTSGLPSAARRSGVSMPCTTALRSMCSSGGDHALEHLPVELRGRALHHEFGALAGVVRRLAHQTRQALHMALERHHAGAHQAVLQLGDDARLLRQKILRLAGQGLEQALNARDVARGLRQRTRELLQRGIAVELQRIEIVAARILVLMAVQHLRFGLDLEAAQLLLEARHGARELRQIEVDGIDLLIEARAEDAHLAGVVEHGVEQIGVDPRHFHALRGRAFASRQHRCAARLQVRSGIELRDRILGQRARSPTDPGTPPRAAATAR